MNFTRIMLFFWRVCLERPYSFFFVLFCRIVVSITAMIVPFYYGHIFDQLSSFSALQIPPEVFSWLSVTILIILWRKIVDLISWSWIDFVIADMETRTMKDLYHRCFRKLHGHSLQFFSNNFSGALVKKVNKLIRGYETFVDIIIFDFIAILITILVSLGVIFWYHQLLGLIFLGWLLVYTFIQIILYKQVRPYEIREQEQDSLVTGVIADTITNHATISTFAGRDRENSRFWLFTEARRSITKKTWNKKQVIHRINQAIMILCECGMLYFMIHARHDGTMSIGIILVIQLYVFRLFEKIFFIGNVIKRFLHALGEAGEMIEILDTSYDIQDVPNASPLVVSWWKIVFDAVCFNYLNRKQIFADFSLTLLPGERVAFVGASWSGKSTIVKLLMRLYDIQWWTITIDDQPIHLVAQESLRSQISLVPQDPLLFHRTLRENIAYAKPEATYEEVIHAAKLAHCHEFISRLPEQYETLVGERWIKLSGWERQRVAIARAILANRPILVLDEATSSLDSETEKYIQQAIQALIQGKTAIVIAHRLSTIKAMDRIIVLDQGNIVEQWTHETLLHLAKGTYQKLREIQSE